MRRLRAAVVLVVACATAQAQPLPRSRPLQAPPPGPPQQVAAEEPAPPSACRLRLTPELAVAPSLPPLAGPGECGAADMVRLEAVVLPDRSRVAVTPPAQLGCGFAEAVVNWVREEVVPVLRRHGAALRSIDNYASYDCRGRNNILGAKVSEHGKGNALDMRALRLADGRRLGLADPSAARDLREALRRGACARFTTVLGPGSDGYHEDHVHVDLAERRGGHRMCQWEVRDPAPELAASAVPLPRPRPAGAR